jgi:hypothetical protein
MDVVAMTDAPRDSTTVSCFRPTGEYGAVSSETQQPYL